GALNFRGKVQSLEHLFEDVGARLLLEDAALDILGQEPELRHHVRLEMDEQRRLVQPLDALPLAKPANDAVKVAWRRVGGASLEGDGDLLAKQLLKRHLLIGGRVHAELEVKQMGNRL